MLMGSCSRFVSRLGFGLSLVFATNSLLVSAMAEEVPAGWQTDFAVAQQLAKEKQRPLLVSVTAVWCGPCRQMKQLTFTDTRVKELLDSKLVAVSVDADQYPSVVSSLGVTAYPTTIFYDANGNRRQTWTGFQHAQGFAAELETLIGTAAAKVDPDPFAPVSALFPQNSSPVAFSGYCLVSLLDDNKLRRGAETVRMEYRGQTLSFHSEAHKRRFQENPERYWPIANGICPLTSEPGDPRVGVRWKGRLWFFSNRDRQQQFIRSPDRFSGNSL